ncbi:TetR family transcriptional regulator [Paraperlucidibaca baekdonensis]|uniref:TetR family transcriptional regulator n=1 Tax=Paraperlucidibaca baekdonensis TaxID=748120 RepID=A0A3E0H9H5_9GAMM|nr:TetR/AcrR family transcriptional regulator [Paraperlucidibaca baekdonensis]REH40337.1 TetR family transcriptional regulator [Paraperlucidibaca baekdonensis]
MSSSQAKPSYHHGDLRRSIVAAGLARIRAKGVSGLSLRQLADELGVSTPALYHHFRNKHALLMGLGEAAMAEFVVVMQAAIAHDASAESFALAYVGFARHEPALYDLIFGSLLWRDSHAEAFQAAARAHVRAISHHVQALQNRGELPTNVPALRVVQVAWASLHGLCRMYNDGLAFTPEAIEDIAKTAMTLMHRALDKVSA